MKREKILHMAVTEDEYKELILLMNTKMADDEKRYTISTYLREFMFKPHINGNSSPSEETVIDEELIKPKKGPWDDISF